MRHVMLMIAALAVFTPLAAAAYTVDAEIPAGNIVVKSIEGVDGDQGKNCRPYDHCRDYNDDRPSIYPEVRAIRAMMAA